MLDIYTKRHISTISEEHVFPRSLGGRLSSTRLIDKSTNDRLGHSIDARLEEGLRAARVMVDARNTDGEPARALSAVAGSDGNTYTVAAGGVARIHPKGALQIEGKVAQLQAVVNDEMELRKMLRKHARRAGKDPDELVQQAMSLATTTTSALPPMNFSMSLWQDEPYRATAKIACNFFALVASETFLRPEFDDIRAFVLRGVLPSPEVVYAIEVDIGADGLGLLDHLVKVEVTATGEVLALVVYFRHLAFLVRLGAIPSLPRLATSYRIDQLGATDRTNHLDDLAIKIPSLQTALERTPQEFVQLATAQMNMLVPSLHEIQRGLWLERIMAPIWQKFFDEVGDGEPTDEQRDALFGAITMEFVRELAPGLAREAATEPGD
ncbi:MAG TPA: hypothetical protein VGC79_32365 [Polyangiaceae bacterium]